MQVTTSRAFRQHYLNTYTVSDFDSFEDYFMYLHLNRSVQWVHVIGGVLAVPLAPWTVYVLATQFNPVPFLLFSLVFYGAGFASHWSGDGQISKTVKDFGPAYLYVLLLNFRVVMGLIDDYEARFRERYPDVLWVYLREAPAPHWVTREADTLSTAQLTPQV